MDIYSCDVCLAECTFEAMMQCCLPYDKCPTIQKLKSGEIVDRRPTDTDPNFPSDFSYAKEQSPTPRVAQKTNKTQNEES